MATGSHACPPIGTAPPRYSVGPGLREQGHGRHWCATGKRGPLGLWAYVVKQRFPWGRDQRSAFRETDLGGSGDRTGRWVLLVVLWSSALLEKYQVQIQALLLLGNGKKCSQQLETCALFVDHHLGRQRPPGGGVRGSAGFASLEGLGAPKVEWFFSFFEGTKSSVLCELAWTLE